MMNSRISLARTVVAIAALSALLSGCVVVSAQKDANSLADVDKDKILVVGKIKLIRPLADKEQILTDKGKPFFKDKAYFLLGKDAYDLNHVPAMAANDSTDVVTLNKTFFLPVEKASALNYSGGIIVMNDWELFDGNTVGGVFGIWNLMQTDHFTLPGGAKFKVPHGDRAVYIGTIEYIRDDFNNITKVRIKDEYAQANAEFHRKFKSGMRLHKLIR